MTATVQERFQKYSDSISMAQPMRVNGVVTQVIGLIIESNGPPASVGEVCTILNREEEVIGLAEVVGFKKNHTLLMPLGQILGIRPGMQVVATGQPHQVPVGENLLGRVLDGLGNPLDGKGSFLSREYRPTHATPPGPLVRQRIKEPFITGIRTIDSIVTLGKGQRMGIFSGSGVGKSVLMGMIARNAVADVNVIGLIGERGREVREFIEKDLGEEGLRHSVVIVATSDQPSLIRTKAALTATTIAEYFREKGKDVLLMMDSLTRVAIALREIGLTIGEPPTTRGYTPSVFTFMPKLLERAGCAAEGSVTGLYTVLVEGDDLDEPVSDMARSILDGHLVLSRALAVQNHYPAIDVLGSISRVMIDVVSKEQKQQANNLLEILSVYKQAEDLINIGAYVKGSNPKIDQALNLIERINRFLRQDINENCSFEHGFQQLKEILQTKKESPIPQKVTPITVRIPPLK